MISIGITRYNVFAHSPDGASVYELQGRKTSELVDRALELVRAGEATLSTNERDVLELLRSRPDVYRELDDEPLPTFERTAQ